MPVCTIFLLCLDSPVPTFISSLKQTTLQPLVTAKVVRWIITPTKLSKQTLHESTSWDLMMILPSAVASLPSDANQFIRQSWSIQAGISSKILESFKSKNARLLGPSSRDIPPLTGALHQPKIAQSAQGLELNDELQDWIANVKGPKGAVSMLNLLAFRPSMKEEYMKYGKAFADSVGSKRGGVAKIVGKVVPGTCSDGCGEWEEIALAHYPSLDHFADMLASEDYQEANHKWRLPSLKDTCILCTTEVEMDWPKTKANL